MAWVSVEYVFMSAMEKVGRDGLFTLSSSARTQEHQIKLVGVRSKTEGGSLQKVVVLSKAVLKNIMNTDSPLGFSSSKSLKIAEGRKDIRRYHCGIAFVLLFSMPLYTATLASKILNKIYLWSDPIWTF